MVSIRWMCAVAAVLLSGEALAQDLTLRNAVTAARSRAPDVLAAHERIAAAKGRHTQAALFFQNNPEVEGEWLDDGWFANAGERRYGVSLSQEFEIAGQQWVRGDVAEREFEATRADAGAFERVYVGRVMEAFYGLLHAGRRGGLAREILGLNEELSGISKRRLDAGDIPEVEHNLVAIETERARAEVWTAEAEEVKARAELNRLLGRPASTPLKAVGELPVAAEREEFALGARAERLDLKAVRMEAAAREAEVSLLRREVVPNLRLSLGWERETGVVGPDEFRGDQGLAMALGGFRDRDDLFLIRLSLPLPLFNRNQGAIREATARRTAAQFQAIALEQTVDAEVMGARADVAAAAGRLLVFGAILPRVDKNVGLLGKAFAAGQINAASLIAAHDRAFRTRLDHLDAQRAYAVARVSLARALGRDPATLVEEGRP